MVTKLEYKKKLDSSDVLIGYTKGKDKLDVVIRKESGRNELVHVIYSVDKARRCSKYLRVYLDDPDRHNNRVEARNEVQDVSGELKTGVPEGSVLGHDDAPEDTSKSYWVGVCDNHYWFLILMVLVGVLLGVGAWVITHPAKPSIPESDGTVFTGIIKDTDPEEVRRMLQEKVDASQFAFKINAQPMLVRVESEEGKTVLDGNFRIQNPPGNQYDMVVEIYLDGDEELVYKSPRLKPNQYIENDKVKSDLENGVYLATARFKAYISDTDTYMGETAAGIKLHVGDATANS